MEELFNSIKESYNSLWHVKVLGESLEIITPMVTTNDAFVSVFVTKRGNDYVVTDGGWITAGYYECELDTQRVSYNKLLQYYMDNYQILQTNGHGRTLFYKKAKDKGLVVNAVFELSNFISAVVSGSFIQFQEEKKERTFRKKVREFLLNEFEKDSFKFGQKLTSSSTIEYSAISHFSGQLQLLNIVTGSTVGYYRDSLCRSNIYFDVARRDSERYKINKTIALLDDTMPSVYYSPLVKEFISLSRERQGNILLPWSEKKQLNEILLAS